MDPLLFFSLLRKKTIMRVPVKNSDKTLCILYRPDTTDEKVIPEIDIRIFLYLVSERIHRVVVDHLSEHIRFQIRNIQSYFEHDFYSQKKN